MAKRKTNYLNNKDMLREIHKSKMTYCSFLDFDNDNQQDIIVDDVKKINKTRILEGRRARAARLSKELGYKVNLRDVKDTDVVFRVMTTEHIPLVPKRKAKAKKKNKLADVVFDELMDTKEAANSEQQDELSAIKEEDIEMVPMRVKFPPFFHYRVDEEGNPYIVGKSHWKGDLETGHFCKDHGRTTDELAMMYMKLCERYATRSNWRGYCVDEQTEALTKRGWLSQSEITENDEILSYDGKNMIWSSIKSIFRDTYTGKMFKMTSRGIDALVTPGHKIVVENGLTKIEHMLESDKVILLGEKIKTSDDKKFSDSLVELIGWIVTVGNFQPKKRQITIYQNEGSYADRIRSCLNNLNFEYSESDTKNITFSIKRKHWQDIVDIIPEKNLTMDFILSLTSNQQELLIETMIDGGGHRTGLLKHYTQKNRTHMDLFQALCALNGQKMNIHYVENKMSFGEPVSYYTANIFSARGNNTRGSSIDLHGGKNNGRKHPGQGKLAHPNFPTVDYNGVVWCPETEYGCFLARRNGKAYLTGNTYNDEMQGQALLQLAAIGLQFNEAKSQNPFAYYTAAVTNSFTRVLNIEKKMQNIRDDIMEANGLTPSWTRQFENDNSDAKYLNENGELKE